MDTFFTVEVQLKASSEKPTPDINQPLSLIYGPYLRFEDAVDIMMNCRSLLKPSDECTLVSIKVNECTLENSIWIVISTKAEEVLINE